VHIFYLKEIGDIQLLQSQKSVMRGSENGVYGVRVLEHFKAKVGERVGHKGF
jgi:hypothetical protein